MDMELYMNVEAWIESYKFGEDRVIRDRKRATAEAKNGRIEMSISGLEGYLIVATEDVDQIISTLEKLKAIAITQEPKDY